MKFNLFLLLSLFLFSCKSTQTAQKKEMYQFVTSQKLENYTFATYVKQKDTILLVAEANALKKCLDKKFNEKVLKKLLQINSLGNTIGFYYKDKDLNGRELYVGNFSPGVNENLTKIYSYNRFPYLITNCNQLHK